MYFTRRATEQPTLARVLPCTLLAALLVSAAASCSDDPAANTSNSSDGSTPPSDSSGGDAGTDADGAAPYDAARLEVSCAVTPCARELSAGWSESFCARLDDGRVVCWGQNTSGELGRDAGPRNATPAPVDGVAGAVALDRACAVVAGGAVACWGPAAALTPKSGALPAARSIRVGVGFACAVLSDGKMSCWGKNADGILSYSDAAPDEEAAPSIVPLDRPVDEAAVLRQTIIGPPDFLCPSCPRPVTHSYAVIARGADGEVSSWGLFPLVGRPTEQKPDPSPGRIAIEHAEHVFGGYGGCVLEQGAPKCWGYGRDNRTGDVRPLPIPLVPRATDITLADYGEGTFGRGCAATPSGEVYCWGENDFGQAGDGTHAFRELPVRVSNLPEPIARVSATATTSCALGVSGRVYCWGDDGFGQRGRKTPNTKEPSPLPVELP